MVKRVPYLALAFGVKAELLPNRCASALSLVSSLHPPIDIWVDIAPKREKIEKKCIFQSSNHKNDIQTLQ